MGQIVLPQQVSLFYNGRMVVLDFGQFDFGQFDCGCGQTLVQAVVCVWYVCICVCICVYMCVCVCMCVVCVVCVVCVWCVCV